MLKQGLSVFLIFCFLASGLPAMAKDGQSKARTLFDLGIFAYESGDYDAAKQYLKKTLSFDPENVHANYYLGKTCLRMGNYKRAALYLNNARSALDKMPDRRLAEELPDLAYHEAYADYRIQKYAKAYQTFRKVAADQPGNILAIYYAGMSMYKQQKFRQALKHLKDAADSKTSVQYNAAYYCGMCYLHMDELETAKKTFLSVQKNGENPTLRRAAEKQLAILAELRRQQRRYALKAKIGWEYDDNEVLEPIDNNDIYAQEADHIFSLYFHGAYDVIHRPNFTAGASYGHYQTMHADFGNLDFTGSLLDLYARYRWEDYTFGISYNPDYYWLGNQSYLQRHEITATISAVFENLLTEFAFTYQRDNNMYEAGRDGHANEGFLRCLYALPEELGSVRAGIGYEENMADSNDYDYESLSTELSYYRSLWWDVGLNLCGEYELKNYDHPHSLLGQRREDNHYTMNFLLSRDVIKNLLTANMGYEYTINDSNINQYEYESNAVKLFLTMEL